MIQNEFPVNNNNKQKEEQKKNNNFSYGSNSQANYNKPHSYTNHQQKRIEEIPPVSPLKKSVSHNESESSLKQHGLIEKMTFYGQGQIETNKIQKSENIQKAFLLLIKSTNAYFSWTESAPKQLKFSSSVTKIVLLGQTYTVEAGKTPENIENLENLIKAHVQSIIWFSYRQQIPSLEVGPSSNSMFLQNKGTIYSDSGWGCMLRCGQMLFAECLQRTKFEKQGKIFQFGIEHDSFIQSILIVFADFEPQFRVSPFSIGRILTEAQEFYDMKQKQWFTSSRIMNVLENLLLKWKQVNLQVINFVDSCIFLDEIAQKALLLNKQTIKQDPHEPWESCVLIMLHLQLGLTQFDQQYYQQIQEMMNWKSFCGALSGSNQKAYYVVGYQNDSFLYLDPHYVQSSLKSHQDLNDPKLYNTFTVSAPRITKYSELSSDFSLGFFIRNSKEYQEFLINLKILEKRHGDDLCFGVIEQYQKIDPTGKQRPTSYTHDDEYEIIE